ncbi:unnamed protein product [Zymoseptoria tritici ST99CH_3D1]|uniref:P450 monooxygenase n=1 Tax=Zymoseptoria tritici (strain CBS 115943 / IPO323) TaxID=336722 RepID=F9X1Q3_ZYMTI|nr:putative P450 monooxygenase [Zymoseptoria tritici IPO323]EGP91812.1 putative P450 monooxygenase [Zymoseptoria tritici IPO323]SMR45571.1 unnamed protein product [Zymoseptoria tritici ST99CH_3D1]
MHPVIIVYAALAALIAKFFHFIYTTLTSPVRDVPGPFAARFSKLWYVFAIWTGKAEQINIELHRKHARDGEYYAPVVRLGPNMYSISRPEKAIYGIGSKATKSSWYDTWYDPALEPSLFPDRDPQRHANKRRMFQSMYALSSLLHYEKYVEAVQSIFQERLSEISCDGKQVDLHHWLQCYAFDVVGNITYGRRFGFLDEGQDVGQMITSLDSVLKYATFMGIFSWAHRWVYKYSSNLPGMRGGGLPYLASTVRKELDSRIAQRGKEEKDGGRVHDLDAPRDFLDLALDAEKDPDKAMTMRHVYAMLLSNVVAGSDTTAVSLSSVIFYVARDPRVLARLREELDQAVQDGKATPDCAAFRETQDMPYFQACIKEGLRLTAATGLPLWRVVPAGGVEMLGHYFPEGTEVGINTWLAHYDQTIWGQDVAGFRPERWIEAQEGDGNKLKVMDSNFMPFGLGSRTCIGRHISYLEMCKVIPMIFLNFDIELVNTKLTTENHWFVKPTNFAVKLRRRQN